MGIDLSNLDGINTSWIPLAGQATGVDVLLMHSSPRLQERFRQMLIRKGIMRPTRDGMNMNNGREDDFFREFAAYYVKDWRGDIKPEGTPFDSNLMGKVIGNSNEIFRQITEVVGEDADFFASGSSE